MHEPYAFLTAADSDSDLCQAGSHSPFLSPEGLATFKP
jgi:hypothetical protein